MLLLHRLKLPGTERSDVVKEAVSLLVKLQDSEALLLEAFSVLEEAEVAALLPSLDEEAVLQVHSALLQTDMPCMGALSKELAARLASLLNRNRLTELWQLLQAHVDDSSDSWVQAAACLLCAHGGRLKVPMEQLSSGLLTEAGKFIEDQGSVIAFAKGFFKHDLGISAVEQWPLRSAALIFRELAIRVPDETSEEKLRLLLKTYSINDADPVVQDSLSKHIKHHIVQQEPSGCEMEGLFLKLSLKEEVDLSSEVLSKLTLEARHLNMATPQQLMLLAHQLDNHGRKQDAAGVAVVAANAFASNDKVREAEEAFLKAFELDPSNPDAAKGLVQAVSSAHERCDQLQDKGHHWEDRCNGHHWEDRCNVLDAECKELRAKCKELNGRCQVLNQSNEELKATRQGLQKSCEELKAKADIPRVELDSPVVWDLSTFDFATIKESPKFQLPGGVEAHLRIWPNYAGHGIDDLDLVVNKQANIKGTVQLDSCATQAFKPTEAKSLVDHRGDHRHVQALRAPQERHSAHPERPGRRLRAALRLSPGAEDSGGRPRGVGLQGVPSSFGRSAQWMGSIIGVACMSETGMDDGW